MSTKSFVPAFHLHAFTKLYDPSIQLIFGKTFQRIAKTIPLCAGMSVLDVGCGSGNLMLRLFENHPTISLTGIDIDPRILAIAKKKIASRPINLIEASATHLPFEANSFDNVISSLAFHHLLQNQQKEAVQEIYRILKPTGTFWLYDFTTPSTPFGHVLSSLFRHVEKEIDPLLNGIMHRLFQNTGLMHEKIHFTQAGMISLISVQKESPVS